LLLLMPGIPKDVGSIWLFQAVFTLHFQVVRVLTPLPCRAGEFFCSKFLDLPRADSHRIGARFLPTGTFGLPTASNGWNNEKEVNCPNITTLCPGFLRPVYAENRPLGTIKFRLSRFLF